METELTVALRSTPPLAVLDLEGSVTTFAEEAINTAYQTVTSEGAQKVLLNFSNVHYVNSAGIAIIIGILTETRKRNQGLLVVGLTPHYQRVFHMMGLSQYVAVFDTEAAALESLRTP